MSFFDKFFNQKQQGILSRWKHILLPVLLLLIGNFYTYHFIVNKNYPSFFYQNEFSPAVLFACGYEFANPASENIPLKSFLDNKTTSFECNNVIPNSFNPLNYFQQLERNMLLSAGFTWKVFGIGWDNLIPLFLVLYSIGLLATYFIFRLGMNHYLSFLFSIFIAVSSLQMIYVTQLRDYSVAPFLLSLICITGKMVTEYFNRKTLFLYSAFAGILLGIGLGFRVDLLVFIPFFLISVLFFVNLDAEVFKTKLMVIIIFLAVFVITGLPVLNAIHSHGGGDLAHIIILGLADSFTSSLGLWQPDVYSIIPAYRDLIPYTVVNSFAERIYGVDTLIPSATKNYSYYNSLFLLKYLSTFPADFLIRIYAAIIQAPLIFIHGYLHAIITHFHLKFLMLVVPVIVMAFVAFYKARLALFLLFSLVYLGAYPVLQFDPRHYFYLEFIGLLFIGILCQQIIYFIKNIHNSELFEDMRLKVNTRWKSVSVLILVCITVPFISLTILRHYQTSHLNNLVGSYLFLKTNLIAPVLNGKKIIVDLPAKKHSMKTSYLDTIYLKITTRKCASNQISLKLHYLEEPPASWEAPKVINLSTTDITTRFLPIYNYHNGVAAIIDEAYLPSYWIDHLEYSARDAACIQNIAYVNELEAIPLLLTLNFQGDWQTRLLYQNFTKL